jgi:hypothetical protein
LIKPKRDYFIEAGLFAPFFQKATNVRKLSLKSKIRIEEVFHNWKQDESIPLEAFMS